MSEMVERAAKTVYEAFPLLDGEDAKPEWVDYRDTFMQRQARHYVCLTIKAMREPTEAMVVAGTLADWVGEAESREGLSIMPNDDYGTPIGIWPEMIDAALGEQKDG